MTLSLDKIIPGLRFSGSSRLRELPEPSSFVIATVNQGCLWNKVRTGKGEPGDRPRRTGEIERGGHRREEGERDLRGGRGKLSMLGVAWSRSRLLGLRSPPVNCPAAGVASSGLSTGGQRRRHPAPKVKRKASARGPRLCDSKAVGVYFRERRPPLPRAWTSRPPRPCPSAPPPPFRSVRRTPAAPASSCGFCLRNRLRVARFPAPRAGWAPPPGALPSPGCSKGERRKPIPGHRASGSPAAGGPLPQVKGQGPEGVWEGEGAPGAGLTAPPSAPAAQGPRRARERWSALGSLPREVSPPRPRRGFSRPRRIGIALALRTAFSTPVPGTSPRAGGSREGGFSPESEASFRISVPVGLAADPAEPWPDSELPSR